MKLNIIQILFSDKILIIMHFAMQEDVAILKQIGFDVYRFSIAWSRILPSKN